MSHPDESNDVPALRTYVHSCLEYGLTTSEEDVQRLVIGKGSHVSHRYKIYIPPPSSSFPEKYPSLPSWWRGNLVEDTEVIVCEKNSGREWDGSHGCVMISRELYYHFEVCKTDPDQPDQRRRFMHRLKRAKEKAREPCTDDEEKRGREKRVLVLQQQYDAEKARMQDAGGTAPSPHTDLQFLVRVQGNGTPFGKVFRVRKAGKTRKVCCSWFALPSTESFLPVSGARALYYAADGIEFRLMTHPAPPPPPPSENASDLGAVPYEYSVQQAESELILTARVQRGVPHQFASRALSTSTAGSLPIWRNGDVFAELRLLDSRKIRVKGEMRPVPHGERDSEDSVAWIFHRPDGFSKDTCVAIFYEETASSRVTLHRVGPRMRGGGGEVRFGEISHSSGVDPFVTFCRDYGLPQCLYSYVTFLDDTAPDEMNALHFAAANGLDRLLLDILGAEEAADEGQSEDAPPYRRCAGVADTEVYDIDETSYFGLSPLDLACYFNRVSTQRILRSLSGRCWMFRGKLQIENMICWSRLGHATKRRRIGFFSALQQSGRSLDRKVGAFSWDLKKLILSFFSWELPRYPYPLSLQLIHVTLRRDDGPNPVASVRTDSVYFKLRYSSSCVRDWSFDHRLRRVILSGGVEDVFACILRSSLGRDLNEFGLLVRPLPSLFVLRGRSVVDWSTLQSLVCRRSVDLMSFDFLELERIAGLPASGLVNCHCHRLYAPSSEFLKESRILQWIMPSSLHISGDLSCEFPGFEDMVHLSVKGEVGRVMMEKLGNISHLTHLRVPMADVKMLKHSFPQLRVLECRKILPSPSSKIPSLHFLVVKDCKSLKSVSVSCRPKKLHVIFCSELSAQLNTNVCQERLSRADWSLQPASTRQFLVLSRDCSSLSILTLRVSASLPKMFRTPPEVKVDHFPALSTLIIAESRSNRSTNRDIVRSLLYVVEWFSKVSADRPDPMTLCLLVPDCGVNFGNNEGRQLPDDTISQGFSAISIRSKSLYYGWVEQEFRRRRSGHLNSLDLQVFSFVAVSHSRWRTPVYLDMYSLAKGRKNRGEGIDLRVRCGRFVFESSHNRQLLPKHWPALRWYCLSTQYEEAIKEWVLVDCVPVIELHASRGHDCDLCRRTLWNRRVVFRFIRKDPIPPERVSLSSAKNLTQNVILVGGSCCQDVLRYSRSQLDSLPVPVVSDGTIESEGGRG